MAAAVVTVPFACAVDRISPAAAVVDSNMERAHTVMAAGAAAREVSL